MQYFWIHIHFNFKGSFLFIFIVHIHSSEVTRAIGCSIGHFECFPFLTHYSESFNHEVVVNWQTQLNCFWGVDIYRVLYFYLLQRFWNFGDSCYLILKFSNGWITKYNKAAHCSQNHGTVEELNIVSCISSNFKSVSFNIKVIKFWALFCFNYFFWYYNFKVGKLLIIECILNWYF